MNVFQKILRRDVEQTVRLGNPLGLKDWDGAVIETGPYLARMNQMAVMTGGRGFQQPKRGPKLSKVGGTRKQREAHLRPIYLANLEAEADFRASVAGKEGWGIAAIRDAIERGEHRRL